MLGQLLALDFSTRRVPGSWSVGWCSSPRAPAPASTGPRRRARSRCWWWPRSSGAVFFAAVFVGAATVAFFWIDSGEFANGFTYGGRDFTSYPINVYSGLFRRLFAYSLGFAFVAYYPALVLLGRPDPLGLPAAGPPGPARWCPSRRRCVAALAWRFGVRHYRSTGS